LLACLNNTINSDIQLNTQKCFTGSEIVGIGVGVFVALCILGQLLRLQMRPRSFTMVGGVPVPWLGQPEE
jgi:hypothetical protein